MVNLVADIGGTNARFALSREGALEYFNERVYSCNQFDTPEDAIRQFLKETDTREISRICIAVAGPVSQGCASLTNNKWTFNEAQIKRVFFAQQMLLINDFQSIAASIPFLARDHLLPIGPHQGQGITHSDFVASVIGPGTGLGVSTIIRRKNTVQVIPSEGGHIGFAPETQRQLEVLTHLRARFSRVSVERLVSGSGIECIHWALDPKEDASPLSAADIFAKYHVTPRATEAVELFFEILGQVAGDIVLANGAFDGLFLAGGIVQRHTEIFINSRFRKGFENKGRHAAIMEIVPSMLITHPYPGLFGACTTLNMRT